MIYQTNFSIENLLIKPINKCAWTCLNSFENRRLCWSRLDWVNSINNNGILFTFTMQLSWQERPIQKPTSQFSTGKITSLFSCRLLNYTFFIVFIFMHWTFANHCNQLICGQSKWTYLSIVNKFINGNYRVRSLLAFH